MEYFKPGERMKMSYSVVTQANSERTTEKQLQLWARPGLEPGTFGFQVRYTNPLDHAASNSSNTWGCLRELEDA